MTQHDLCHQLVTFAGLCYLSQTMFTPLDTLRAKRPLIHHITNAVTIHDCANITLAIGASPVMADAPAEVEEMVAIAAALVLNIGTLNDRTIAAMHSAGKRANALNIPVILDPVGAGATTLRNDTVRRLLDEIRITVLRGNRSEIAFISGQHTAARGVDATDRDARQTLDHDLAFTRELALRHHCVIAMTGATDIVTDGARAFCVHNGHPMLTRLTGTGCMCTALVGAFCGALPDRPLDAALNALASMAIAGEIAFAKAGAKGTASFHTALLDAISCLTPGTLAAHAKIDARP